MTPKISIIIPIYSTAKYLDKCLQSVVQQTMQEIEVICVDDCSPDESYLIVEKYIKQDARVSLIRHKENKGLGGARNTGILTAKADFIASVDSDDFIQSEMMETLWKASNAGEYDIVCCGFDRVNESGEQVGCYKPQNITVINDSNKVDIFALMNPAFWNKLWRKSLFIDNHILFPGKLYYEDLATTPRLISHSKSIKMIDDSLYSYLVRPDSITKTYSEKHISDYFEVFDILLAFLRKNTCFETYKMDFLHIVDSQIYLHVKNILVSDMSDSNIRLYLFNLLQKKMSYLNDNFNIKNAKTDLSVNSMSQKSLISLLMPKSQLSLIQRLGSDFFGFIFTPFIDSNQLEKLKENPRSFFKDSRNILTRAVGLILRII